METNKNMYGLKVGDIIEVQQAWEDEQGNDHDEFPTILEIDEKTGRMKLDFNKKEINDFLEGADFFANDYKKDNPQ